MKGKFLFYRSSDRACRVVDLLSISGIIFHSLRGILCEFYIFWIKNRLYIYISIDIDESSVSVAR